MAELFIPHLDDQTQARLQRRAFQHGHNLEEEVSNILRAAVAMDEVPPKKLGTWIVEHFSGQGIGFDEPIEELRGYTMKPAKFE